MKTVMLLATLMVPCLALATPAKPLSASALRRDIKAKLGPGMMGSGWSISLGAKSGSSRLFYAKQNPAKNWPRGGGIGPALIPASGKINEKTGKITFDHVE